MKSESTTNEDKFSRYDAIERRLEDNRNFLQLFLTAGAALTASLFAVLAIFVAWSQHSERDYIEKLGSKLESRIELSLNERGGESRLEILAPNGKKIDSEEIEVEKIYPPTEMWGSSMSGEGFPIDFRLKNFGESATGQLHLKIYSNSPLVPYDQNSSDNSIENFIYEFWDKSFDTAWLNTIPGGGYSRYQTFVFWLDGGREVPIGDSAKLKIELYSDRKLEATAVFSVKFVGEER